MKSKFKTSESLVDEREIFADLKYILNLKLVMCIISAMIVLAAFNFLNKTNLHKRSSDFPTFHDHHNAINYATFEKETKKPKSIIEKYHHAM